MQFGGRIGFEGYEPGELNVTMRGAGLQFRFPEGVRSVVDADLTLRGNVKAPTLGGSVTVKEARYTKRIDAPETILDFAVRRPFDAGGGGDRRPGRGDDPAALRRPDCWCPRRCASTTISRAAWRAPT